MSGQMQLQKPMTMAVDARLPHTSSIPFKRDSQEMSSNVSLAVVGLLLMLVAGWWWLRRQVNSGTFAPGARRAKILETHRLGPRSALVVVEFAGQHHLIAQTEHAVTCLAQSPAAEMP